MDSSGEWSGGLPNTNEPQVEDEFTCTASLRDAVLDLQPAVKRVFRVQLGIAGQEGDQIPPTDQVWLKLKGRYRDVAAAKLFVKGLINQEEQQEVSHPVALNCVFSGACGLFMDCLIRTTSAHIMVGSPGFLLISGLVEPVVQACSLLVSLVERYETCQDGHINTGAGEHLDCRPAFKELVEQQKDRHLVDLLMLPAPVKQVLLDLVKDSGWDLTTDSADPLQAVQLEAQDRTGTKLLDSHARLVPTQSDAEQPPVGVARPPLRTSSTVEALNSSHEGWALPAGAGGTERPDALQGFRPAEAGARFQAHTAEIEAEGSPGGAQGLTGLIPQGRYGLPGEVAGTSQEDFSHLLKFFTAMGFREEVVRRVLSRTGPRDAFEILEMVQHEQDQEEVTLKRNGDSLKTARREAGDGANEEPIVGEKKTQLHPPGPFRAALGDRSPRKAHGNGTGEDDFVMGVVKRAAASCGYSEERVLEVCSNLPELSFHQLLLELQRLDSKDDKPAEEDVIVEDTSVAPAASTTISQKAPSQNIRAASNEKQDKILSPALLEHRDIEKFLIDQAYQTSSQTSSAVAKGRHLGASPQSHSTHHRATGPVSEEKIRTKDWATVGHQTSSALIDSDFTDGASAIRGPPEISYWHEGTPAEGNTHSTMPNPVRGPSIRPGLSGASGATVTGQQRFLEGLHKSFELKLTDSAGDPGLRQVIIDGSNIAWSHGLGQFFSCRGIALAVQHFWEGGHRNISAFIPQWRLKRDHKVKEPHYLTQLSDLGLLSLTPSREVLGKKISSYDDRFMLQLAQKTDGVIVTNDNLKDLFEESDDFKDIIRTRLLQYTFVGDHFMVPDDPLGRNGPHLKDFLRSKQSPPSPQQHFKSKQRQYHDRTVGGNRDIHLNQPVMRPLDPASMMAPHGEQMRRGRADGVRSEPDSRAPQPQTRSPEETTRLRESLELVFPGQAGAVRQALQSHPALTDVNTLSHFILEQQSAEG